MSDSVTLPLERFNPPILLLERKCSRRTIGDVADPVVRKDDIVIGADPPRIATLVAVQSADDLGIRLFNENFGGSLFVMGKALRVEGTVAATDLVACGMIQIDIAGLHALEKVADAYRHGENGHRGGKIAMVPAL